jgi:hypothetical protein
VSTSKEENKTHTKYKIKPIHVIQFNSIQFNIYLNAELSSQWPVTESAQIQATIAIRQHRTTRKKKGKVYQLRLLNSNMSY